MLSDPSLNMSRSFCFKPFITLLSAWKPWHCLIHKFGSFSETFLTSTPANCIILLYCIFSQTASWNIFLFVYYTSSRLSASSVRTRTSCLFIHCIYEKYTGNGKCTKPLVKWRKLKIYNNQHVTNCKKVKENNWDVATKLYSTLNVVDSILAKIG